MGSLGNPWINWINWIKQSFLKERALQSNSPKSAVANQKKRIKEFTETASTERRNWASLKSCSLNG